MSTAVSTQRQFQVAQLLQSVLLIIGVLMLGAGLGYFLSLSTVADTACGAPFDKPPVCTAIIPALNTGIMYCLGGGVVALATSGAMHWGLGRVDL